MSTLISIIVPVFNCEKYLDQCLQSLSEQTYKNLEIILIDDGSTDGSGAICDDYAVKDSRFKVKHKINQGVSVSRNIGLEIASGEWIMFVDADDWLETEICEILFYNIDRQYDFLTFARNVQKKRKSLCKSEYKGSYIITKDEISTLLRKTLNNYITFEKGKYEIRCGTCWGKLYRKSFLDSNKITFRDNMAIAEDVLFLMNVFNKAKLAKAIDYKGYNYRMNRESVLHKYNSNIFKQTLYALNNIEDYLVCCHFSDESELDVFIIRKFLYCCRLDYCNSNNRKSYLERKKDCFQNRNHRKITQAFNNKKSIQILRKRYGEYIMAVLIKHNMFFFLNILNKLIDIRDYFFWISR